MSWCRIGFRQVTVCLVILSSGCAGPQPILHPNQQYEQAGPKQAEADVTRCREQADAAGASEGSGKGTQVATGTAVGAGVGAAGGAVGGAITGSSGIGAAVGAVSGAIWGLLSGLFSSGQAQPSQAYVSIVNRCLQEKGYEVAGWQ
ncbi:MAG: hypothetical protein H0V35_07910 [Nitrospira sp.]|nr:hypothetical protein [Nitrospira sp.]